MKKPLFAANLTRLRKKHLLTQRALAKLSGISRPVIATLEIGRYQSARSVTLERLARALREDVAEFFRAAPKPKRRA